MLIRGIKTRQYQRQRRASAIFSARRITRLLAEIGREQLSARYLADASRQVGTRVHLLTQACRAFSAFGPRNQPTSIEGPNIIGHAKLDRIMGESQVMLWLRNILDLIKREDLASEQYDRHRFCIETVDEGRHVRLDFYNNTEAHFVDGTSSRQFEQLSKAIHLSGAFLEVKRIYDWRAQKISRVSIIFPKESPYLVMQSWDFDRTIDRVSRRFASPSGSQKTTRTMEACMEGQLDFQRTKGHIETYLSRESLKGAQVMIIGPSKTPHEVIQFIHEFPDLEAVHLVDVKSSVFVGIERHLAKTYGGNRPKTKIIGHHAGVLELPSALMHQMSIVYDAYVFADGWFCLRQVARSGREIARVLLPNGIHISAGGHLFPSESIASNMTILTTKSSRYHIFRKN